MQIRNKELIGDGTDAAALQDLADFITSRGTEGGIIYARLRQVWGAAWGKRA